MKVEQAKLPTPDLAQPNAQVNRRHDAFAARGLKLDLSREKSSAEQLALSDALLSPVP
jgi:hypothetical protein